MEEEAAMKKGTGKTLIVDEKKEKKVEEKEEEKEEKEQEEEKEKEKKQKEVKEEKEELSHHTQLNYRSEFESHILSLILNSKT